MRPSSAAPAGGADRPDRGAPDVGRPLVGSPADAQEDAPPAPAEGAAPAEGPVPAEGAAPPASSATGDAAAGDEPAEDGPAEEEAEPEVRRPPEPVMTVLLYSDDVRTRQAVKLAVGRRPAPGLPRVVWRECATPPAVVAAMDAGGIDVAVLDGEAAPAGGMGLCRQLKNEIYRCPPVLVLTGRPQDAWLAAWSLADLAVPHPLDPMEVAAAVTELARRRLAA